MAALKSQADKEQSDFETEWKELGKMIEQDRKMKDFMKKEREKLSQQARRRATATREPPRRARARVRAACAGRAAGG